NLFAVKNDVQLQQGGQGEKIAIPENGKPQDAVLPDLLYLLEKIGQKIGAEPLYRIGGRNPLDTAAGQQTQDRQQDQDQCRPLLSSLEEVGQESTRHGAQDDGQKGA